MLHEEYGLFGCNDVQFMGRPTQKTVLFIATAMRISIQNIWHSLVSTAYSRSRV
jgi:hypothetical protein